MHADVTCPCLVFGHLCFPSFWLLDFRPFEAYLGLLSSVSVCAFAYVCTLLTQFLYFMFRFMGFQIIRCSTSHKIKRQCWMYVYWCITVYKRGWCLMFVQMGLSFHVLHAPKQRRKINGCMCPRWSFNSTINYKIKLRNTLDPVI